MLIALSVFLVLILFALSRVILVLRYDDNGFSGYVRYLFFKVRFPGKPKEKTLDKEPEQEKKPGDLKQFSDLISPFFTAVGKLVRMLRINLLIADISIGSDDAFTTAMTYGAACAGIGTIFPFIGLIAYAPVNTPLFSRVVD